MNLSMDEDDLENEGI